MFAVAFAARDTLARTGDLAAGMELAAVQEAVRPAAGAVRVVRELEGLGVTLVLAGNAPRTLLRRIAQVVWFRGNVVDGSDPVAASIAHLGLPAECLWYVTAQAAEAEHAREMGCNAVLLDPAASASLHGPDGRGRYVAVKLDDVLEILRVPYTRAALNLRYVVRKLLDNPPLGELVR